ncbi:MAG: hypothetical protein PUG50_04245 [Eubacteriales bacterium]|uniref:hypothetical protein n=1 Tax=Fenollaria sp. TaxID=1965292 RepID=UPI002A74DAFE|nr:hypothetical protein [Fenollaria sp.]MDD7339768.1 hypothetical protein [Eubacteriales bacterium]MDY3106336.1 hypothetical protein [Fenollaria sp.]
MKTKEFIKKIEKMGYDIEIAYDTIRVTYDGGILARIDKVKPYTLDTKATFEVKHVKELFDLCTQYARTPTDEREEEQKFYLQKIKSFYEYGYNEKFAYLLFITDRDEFGFGSTKQGSNAINRFTQKEIDKIKQEQHTDLSEFKQIPVEEIEVE